MAMLYPRYYGRFRGLMSIYKIGDGYTTAERLWEVTIYQLADGPFEVEDLIFSAESPLQMEWSEVAPEDVIEGSTATLRLISPSDRKFTDLYAINPLSVVLEVKAGGDVVWRGSIEPELYEEPYSTKDGYEVELTFSDLSPMERREFSLSGRVTFEEILSAAVSATSLSGYRMKCSTVYMNSVNGTQDIIRLSQLYISSDNFYDEDGEAKTLSEAVETILRPFGLKMRQQGGRVWIYDWHALATESPSDLRIIDWTSTDQTLSIAPVAHAVTLNYSTYADTTLAESTPDIDELTKSDPARTLSVNVDYNTKDPVAGFKLFTYSAYPDSTLPKGMRMISNNPLFRIEAGFSGSNTSGIYGYALPTGNPNGISFGSDPGNAIFTLTGPTLTLRNSFVHFIKITLDMLIDVRYNPYESASKYNEEGNWSRLQNWANFGYIPVALELVGDSGSVVCHYVNSSIKSSNSASLDGRWVAGPANPGDMWLAYYDPGDRKSASGWGGWKKNRQCIGYYRDDLPTLTEKRGEGEFVPFPLATDKYSSGTLRLTVYSGADWMDYKRQGEAYISGTVMDIDHSLSRRVRWMLYGTAEMEIVKGDGTKINTDDIIYTATAIDGAASDVDITIEAGSAVDAPTARSVISIKADSSTALKPISRIFRRSRTATVEELLLDTLVSQYDQPHTILTGQANLAPCIASEPHSWQDRAQPSDKHFIPTAATVDAAAGTAEITFREISPDIYSPV